MRLFKWIVQLLHLLYNLLRGRISDKHGNMKIFCPLFGWLKLGRKGILRRDHPTLEPSGSWGRKGREV